MIKVLHVLPHRGGGGETYIDLLERMPGFAHERFYLSTGRSPASALVSIPRRWPALVARLRVADLLHVHGDVASAIVLPLLRRRPAVVTTQGLHLLRRARGVRRRAVSRAMRTVASAARAVICSSVAERDELAHIVHPRDARKLQVIYNATVPPAPGDPVDRLAVREQLGVGADCVLGLFAGQLEARKAPLLAAAAAAQLDAAGLPFVLAVAGDGPQAGELQPFADRGAIRLLGHRDDLPRLLRAADIFVQPSEREGMSFVLLEAMAHGLAVVAADGAGNPEALGEAGLLFPAGDEPALVAALSELAGDPARRERLGTQAAARVAEHFDLGRFLAETEAVYSAALGFREPGRGAGGSPA